MPIPIAPSLTSPILSKLKIGFLAFALFLILNSCKKEGEDYDPSGKCGIVLKSEWTNSGAWKLTVQMDDGYIYTHGVSATAKSLGDRVCF